MTRLSLAVCALALVACEARRDLVPHGQIADWTAGAGYELYVVASGDAQQLALSRGPIAADGSFSLPMAVPPPDSALTATGRVTVFPYGCESTPRIEPRDFKTAVVELVVRAPDGRDYLASIAATDPAVVDSFMYSDEEASVVGRLACATMGVLPTKFDLHLAHGYNLTRVVSASGYSSFATLDMPSPLLLTAKVQ